MSHLHLSPHAVQVTKAFAAGSVLTFVLIASVIGAAVLTYAWSVA